MKAFPGVSVRFSESLFESLKGEPLTSDDYMQMSNRTLRDENWELAKILEERVRTSLQEGGVPIRESEPYWGPDLKLDLFVIHDNEDDFYVYRCKLTLSERVQLARDTNLKDYVCTWESRELLGTAVGKEALVEKVLSRIDDGVKEFVVYYRDDAE